MEAALAPIAENAAIGGDTEEHAFHIDRLPNVLCHQASEAAEAED